ncbi:unnamed protein product, partial [Rotaria sp. Silwood1]
MGKESPGAVEKTEAKPIETADPITTQEKTDPSVRRPSFLESIIAETKPIGSIYTSEPTSTDSAAMESRKKTPEHPSSRHQELSPTESMADKAEIRTPTTFGTLSTALPSEHILLTETEGAII